MIKFIFAFVLLVPSIAFADCNHAVAGLEAPVPCTQAFIDARAAEESTWLADNIEKKVWEYQAEMAAGEITYNGITITNDEKTIADLNARLSYLLIANDPATKVSVRSGEEVKEELTVKDIEGLLKAAGAWTQKTMDAAQAVMATEAAAPYASWTAAKTDFDAALED